MINRTPLIVVFYKNMSGREPVREWLKGLSKNDKKMIGEDIKTVQFGWPIGMPVVRKLEEYLWEIRTRLDNRISRIFVTIQESRIILLHGFIKKEQKTPQGDLQLARKRLMDVRGKHE
jgi:phage-related protein